MNFDIISKNTDKFSKLETILYENYPQYVDSENYFFVNGNKINKHRSLQENKINNNDVITLKINNFE